MEITEIPKPGTISRSKKSSPPPIVVEELVDEEMESSGPFDPPQRPTLVTEPSEPKRMGRSPSLGPNPYTFSPSIPSPLRLVSMPEEDELDEDMQAEPQILPSISAILGSAPIPLSSDPRQVALDAPKASLPKYHIDVNFTATVITNTAAAAGAMALSIDRLPKYDMSRFAPPPTAAPAAFNWSAAGFKPPVAAAGTWKCSSCMLSNPDSAAKCGVCDAAKPGAENKATSSVPPTAPAVPFNWSQAGFAPPKAAAGSWTCTTCGLSNPATAVDKCLTCEAAREQGSAKAEAPKPEVPRSFNWAAAGITRPMAAPGTWSCSDCGLSNPASASKCTVCDKARG